LAIKVIYSLDQIIRRRDELVEILKFEYRNKVVRGEDFQRFVDICEEAVERFVKKPHRPTLIDSLRHLAGVKLDEKLIADTAHRLMGNLHRIRYRRKVVPWHGQRFYEWVPVQVMAVRRAKNDRGEVGATLTLKFMAGSPCPLIVLQWWSMRRCRYVSRDFGFSRPVGPLAAHPARYPYVVPEQLVTLRFMGLIDPTKSIKEPVICEINSAPSTRKWNIAQLKRRIRDGFQCPKRYPLDFECHHCPIGYVHCPAATHRLDYETKPCPKCNKDDAVWNPELPVNMCIDCYMSTYVYIPSTSKKDKYDDEDDSP
jgi:hypothetical protein